MFTKLQEEARRECMLVFAPDADNTDSPRLVAANCATSPFQPRPSSLAWPPSHSSAYGQARFTLRAAGESNRMLLVCTYVLWLVAN